MKKKRRYKKKTKKPISCTTCAVKDRHHLLYQRRHYTGFWANKLRYHPYSIILIPKNTMHRAIHRAVDDITVPSEDKCKDVYERLCEKWDAGEVKETDNIEKRLDVLIELFASAPATIECLKRQKDVAKKGG